MSNIVKFPCSQHVESKQEQSELIDMPENELEKMYDSPDDYISSEKCFKCGKVLKHGYDSEEIWYFVNQRGGYGSQLDGSQVDIKVCDFCMMKFLGVK